MTVAVQNPAAEPVAGTTEHTSLLTEIAAKTQTTLSLRAIEGTLTEKIAAFKELGAALAQLRLNGWDTVAKCIAACWLADGLGMHPAIFMQNNYCAEYAAGKIVVIPQWPLVLALLRSRVPGFTFRMVEDSERGCTVVMGNARDTHTETYTIKDAARQGLVFLKPDGTPDYDNPKWKYSAWKGGNLREMFRAKAIRRGGSVIGPEAMMGLPSGGDFDNDAAAAEDAPAADMPSMPVSVTAGTSTAVEVDWKESLRTEIRARWGGGLKGKKMLEIANLIAKEVGLEAFKSADEITSESARRMVEFLRQKYGLTGKAGASAAENTEQDSGMDAAPSAPEVPLEMEAEVAAEADADGDVATLLKLADKGAVTHPGVVFVKEAPKGSGAMYFVHGPTVKNMGLSAGILLSKAKAQVVSPDVCRRLVVAMRTLGVVDAAPRT